MRQTLAAPAATVGLLLALAGCPQPRSPMPPLSDTPLSTPFPQKVATPVAQRKKVDVPCRFTATHARGADPTRRGALPAAAREGARTEAACLRLCDQEEKDEKKKRGQRRLTTACWFGRKLLFTHDFAE